MQRFLLAGTLLLGLGVFLSFGNSSGPGAVQMKDRTGSPLAEGFCQNCHSAGAFNPSISVALLNEDNEAVTDYTPNEPYTLQVTINADMAAQRFGFQATALYGDEDLRAGTFGSLPTTQVTELNSRQYAEHSEASTTNVWNIPWTAPSEDVGAIRFYAAGIAANNSSTSSGDGSTRLQEPFVVNSTISSSNEQFALATALQAVPNPVQRQTTLHITLDQALTGTVQVWSSAGQLLQQQKQDFYSGLNTVTLDLEHLPAGHYRAVVTDGQRVSTVTLFKS